MPLECGTIVGFESRESSVGKLRPQQSNEVESWHALANPEDLAHQALRPVTPNRAPYSARCDDAQPAAVETVWKREQGQVAAPDAETLPLNAEELPAPPNPVVPRQCTIHDPRCREDPSSGSCTRYLTTRKDASAPSRGAVSGFPCRPWCSFACETRGSACAAGCLADKCASCPRRSRQFKAVHPRGSTVYQTDIIEGTSSSSQRPPNAACARIHEFDSGCRHCAAVVHSRSPAVRCPSSEISTGCGRNCGSFGLSWAAVPP